MNNNKKTKKIRKKIGGLFYNFKRVTPLVMNYGLVFYPGDTFFYRNYDVEGVPDYELTYYRVITMSKVDHSGNINFQVVEEKKGKPNLLNPNISQRNFSLTIRNFWKFYIREEKYNATKQKKKP